MSLKIIHRGHNPTQQQLDALVAMLNRYMRAFVASKLGDEVEVPEVTS